MNLLRFDDKDDYFEMALAIEEEDDLPSRGDAYIAIAVRSAGFEGRNDLWVTGAALCGFCKALVALEEARTGEATLKSVSPGELELRVCSVSSGGHVAVAGSTGYEVQRQDAMFLHSVSFGFQFDPSQLVTAAKLEWVKSYAA